MTPGSKGRTIRKFMWVGGEVPKKYSRKGKSNEKKILARQLILNNIHAMAQITPGRYSYLFIYLFIYLFLAIYPRRY